MDTGAKSEVFIIFVCLVQGSKTTNLFYLGSKTTKPISWNFQNSETKQLRVRYVAVKEDTVRQNRSDCVSVCLSIHFCALISGITVEISMAL